MEAISLLLEASEVQDCGEFVLDYASRVGAKPLADPSNQDIEVVDAILHLRGDSFDSTTGNRGWQEALRLSPSAFGDLDKGGRRRRAMSEPWVMMSSSTFGSSKDDRPSPFHPVLLQPRFPQPLMAIPTQPHAPGMPLRMPTIEELAPICNRNGRIGIYTKDEREVLIRRFREKKKRRIWKKKIRYECRKDLADRRTRVKGRFVKAPHVASNPTSTTATSSKKSMKGKAQGVILTIQASGSVSSDNTSEETGSGDSQPPLTFQLSAEARKKRAVPATSASSSNARAHSLKALQLDRFDNAEDRLKYLAGILGADMSDSMSPEDDEEDDEEDEEEDNEEDGDDPEDDEAEDDIHDDDRVDSDHAMKIDLPQQPSPSVASPVVVTTKSGRTVRPSRSRSGSEVDYRRRRRHSIAY